MDSKRLAQGPGCRNIYYLGELPKGYVWNAAEVLAGEQGQAIHLEVVGLKF